jgi:hypothetical protein
MGADCKSAGFAYAGSNPARPKEFHLFSMFSILVRFLIKFGFFLLILPR